MKQEWIDKKEKERQLKIETLKKTIRDEIAKIGYNDTEVQAFMDNIEEQAELGLYGSVFEMLHNEALINRWKDDLDLWCATVKLVKRLPYEELTLVMRYGYDQFLDSEPKHFHGDIIITDPCYIIKDEDWVTGDYNCIPGSICRSTLYGDWSCTAYDTITGKPIGVFCADAGMVGVFDLAEVLRYNPGFDYHITKEWTTTLIKDFDGEVWFEVEYIEPDSDHGEDYEVHVVGKGVNFVTKEPVSFKTSQRGL